MTRLHLRLAVVVVTLFASACSIELQHDLSEEDANEIYVLLQQHGINASKLKEEGGNEPRYIISTPKQDVAAAAQLLKDHSLPRPMADGLAVFKKNKGMIPTQTEERAMFIEALGGEVSNALNRIPGVLEARTIVMIPENNDLTQPEKKPQPSAAVLIKYRPQDGKPPVSADDVREFVSRAVPELKKENVTVLMTEAPSIAEMEVDNANRMQSVIGIRVDKSSAETLKLVLAGGAVLFLLMAVVMALLAMRRPASAKGPTRAKSSNGAGAEG
jgi:type III secretion protein J